MKEFGDLRDGRINGGSVLRAPAILLAAASLLIMLAPGAAVGQGEPSLGIREQCANARAGAGETVTLHVDFSSGSSQVGAFRLAFEFAPDVLTLPNGENDIRLGPALAGLGGGALFKEVNNSAGKILLFYPISLPPLPQIPDGTVLEIDVQVKAGVAVGCSLLPCTQVEFSGLDGKKLPGGSCSGGGVTVESPLCGNTNIDPGEDCDPPTWPDGCCTKECRFAPVGTACGDDGDVCTDDQCDGNGVCGQVANTAPCDDGLFCNAGDSCGGGSCSVHAGDPCVGGDECNTVCNEDADNCFDPSGTGCTDDGNVCTDDECDGRGNCAHPDNTASCDDGLFCNGTDTCAGGQCAHSGDPCAGGDECNTVCDEGSDNCFNPSGTGCTDDGDVCTEDVCDGAGSCIHLPVTATCGDGCVSPPEQCDPPGSPSQCPKGGLCLTGCVCEQLAEVCDNGVDDDGDLLVDRDDPDCQLKATLKCQKGIEKAGRMFVDAVLRRTMMCVSKMLKAQLAEERDGDEGALADFRKGIDRCDRELGKIFDPRKGAERAKVDKIKKECGLLGDMEVLFQSHQGLGFDLLRDLCLTEHGIELRTLDDVIACIDTELSEFGTALSSVLGPRTCELFLKARGLPPAPRDNRGKRPGTFEDETGAYLDGVEVALICSSEAPTAAESSELGARQLASCHTGLGKASLTLFRGMVKRLLRCVDGLLAAQLAAEVGQDSSDKFEKALDRCDAEIGKLFVGEKSAVAGLSKSVRRACKRGSRALSNSELMGTTGGLGFEALRELCQGKYGIDIDGIDGIISCIDEEARWYALRITSKLKPRACEMIERALGTPPCPSPDERKKCLDDVTRELLAELKTHLICRR